MSNQNLDTFTHARVLKLYIHDHCVWKKYVTVATFGVCGSSSRGGGENVLYYIIKFETYLIL